MYAQILGGILTVLLAATGCSRPESTPAVSESTRAEPSSIQGAAAFVNRVWVVAESKQVALGELRVFLSEGTLVMASPNGKPALGTWRNDGGRFTITEEGREYPVEIQELNQNVFRIRIQSPGEPVDIRFQPAGQPPVTTQVSDQPEKR